MKYLKAMNKLVAAILVLGLMVTFSSCGDDDDPVQPDPDVYTTVDQMGRPAINTVFNFFGTAEVKNAFNLILPSDGSANATAFKGILDALQTYIFLDPAQFENILGIDNEALAGVLAVDVLTSDKTSSSAYGSLNGRTPADDVIDVTLLLAFADQSTAGESNQVKDGVSSDNVDANDKAFGNTFPYLASPH
ncbi:MAG: DUF4331 family protein [Cyclobacteriaceae bacterium]